ncbi:hypothetical protein FIBSPDRAFT_936563 [Athelia psychrophila]|uniref:Uncharacterized protein n=1 Tax=Athelia psychrophila TaxID=1759441 RepID=A0A166BY53_9AGAM|nr:hypothetical protein FIBSPDRAFT_936563 [Fibularhizoctonia sp. CBS 109695]
MSLWSWSTGGRSTQSVSARDAASYIPQTGSSGKIAPNNRRENCKFTDTTVAQDGLEEVAKKISEQASISVISLLRNGIFLREEETFGMTVEAAASLERPAVSSDHVVPTYEVLPGGEVKVASRWKPLSPCGTLRSPEVTSRIFGGVHARESDVKPNNHGNCAP